MGITNHSIHYEVTTLAILATYLARKLNTAPSSRRKRKSLGSRVLGGEDAPLHQEGREAGRDGGRWTTRQYQVSIHAMEWNAMPTKRRSS